MLVFDMKNGLIDRLRNTAIAGLVGMSLSGCIAHTTPREIGWEVGKVFASQYQDPSLNPYKQNQGNQNQDMYIIQEGIVQVGPQYIHAIPNSPIVIKNEYGKIIISGGNLPQGTSLQGIPIILK